MLPAINRDETGCQKSTKSRRTALAIFPAARPCSQPRDYSRFNLGRS